MSKGQLYKTFRSPTVSQQQDAVWEKNRVDFNTAATEQRTTEQLRTKYDNLKKDTRRYFAKPRQNLYRNGGGLVEDDIRGVIRDIRDIYEKIKATINMSVIGMEARLGDSDNIDSASQSVPPTSAAFCESASIPPPNNEAIIVEDQCSSINIDVISIPFKPDSDKENCAVDDWSSYSAAMLKRKKHNVLRV
ncbi:hypothetical protein RN001_005623 [Aquatica leii]|uniref:Regulatory protein zeste n=1 Tax=Aquatica leii TaxID=1421715 RepID=A0AAN7Q0K4_9COLE|nr:hypothetical protein RN001_005623 [Aquatica leii]